MPHDIKDPPVYIAAGVDADGNFLYRLFAVTHRQYVRAIAALRKSKDKKHGTSISAK